MTTERAWVVGIPIEVQYEALLADIHSAMRRSRKAAPGDRLDIVRFEALATRLEQAALNDERGEWTEVPVPPPTSELYVFGPEEAWSADLPEPVRAAARQCVATGRLPVLVLDPFDRGSTALGATSRAEAPAQRWKSDGERGREAVQKRFRAQILEALASEGARRAPIMPSGIQNPVVTEILREFVNQEPGVVRQDVVVEYRDGSRSAHPFPLRSLPLREQFRPPTLHLRFALLSIRHTEMDTVVDGAWLRNAEISRPRPAAQTDDLVYAVSREQLQEVCRNQGHVRLTIYQTGLETAVVGFYRALTDHLLQFPESVSVQPMYFEGGAVQAKKNRRDAPSTVVHSSLYKKGTPWAT